MYTSLVRCAKRPVGVPCRSSVSVHRLYTNKYTSEVEHPNLGFEPGLLKGKENKHDHPQRPASKFISQVPPIEVAGRIAWCDGGALGHPRVFINLDPSWDGGVPCGYCGLRYVMKEGHHEDHH